MDLYPVYDITIVIMLPVIYAFLQMEEFVWHIE